MRFIVQEDKLIAVKNKAENTFSLGKINSIPDPPLNPAFRFIPELQAFLTGKQLLIDELPFTLEQIQNHYENGYLTYRKGIDNSGKKPICVRCGNQDLSWFASFPCSRCGETCLYCRKCLMMGRVSACTPLLGWKGPAPQTMLPPQVLAWNGKLSEGQKTASDQVVEAVHQNKELLVWAVCGAGKTEVLFQGIEAALTAGKRVCIATPRTDVVLELTPRLKAAFPGITVASLYGGSEDRHLYAPLTIATTHQLLRFYQAFDTVIVDEVDAFPYTADRVAAICGSPGAKANLHDHLPYRHSK